jgi:anaerobic selenocysteine-containing dehydrogenase
MCTLCDPPAETTEATHDTPEGRSVAESVIRDSRSRDINDGDLVEVVSNTGRNTWLADVGSVGTVTSIETINDSISVHLDDVPGKKNVLAGYVSLCDVRKVTT